MCPPLPESIPEVTHGPPVACECRCGLCCRDMAIRATVSDVAREPRLAEVGTPFAYDEKGEPVAWLLNPITTEGLDGLGPCPFLKPPAPDDPAKAAVCTIHETRPDVCRRLDCDALKEIALSHLNAFRNALIAKQAAMGLPTE